MPPPTAPPLLRALAGDQPDRPPIWFMRQAGRSLPEYHQVRGETAMLDACLRPDMAAELTLQPVRRHQVDAAIFFSDIVVPLKLAGIDVRIEPGVGPVFGEAISDRSQLRKLTSRRLEDVAPIQEAIRIAKAELDTIGDFGTPLIGFAGGPFTLAAYLIEGKPSRDHLAARTMMYADREAWHELMDWVTELGGDFLSAQVDAGADAVQLFDSWAGSNRMEDYRQYVMPYSERILDRVQGRVPRIHFGTNTDHFLELMMGSAEALGMDHRVDLHFGTTRIRAAYEEQGITRPVVVQGNIDPAALFAPWPRLRAHVDHVIRCGSLAQGHVLNLGHGVPPQTDPDVLTRLVAYVHGEDVA
ncbi:uroporphyrinogen decarboxylase [Parenemella sanctibonifatiensis]|uniref:Uroporphyrinogen decarboxylase n=1 Tax=Parenemella sanctibonifatiensis TaxID=2016505 RepID=A0A255EDC1_9ACTN|nr:uroporphyrinogen decarboxylase [Parenemella sanctibonifatiensis]